VPNARLAALTTDVEVSATWPHTPGRYRRRDDSPGRIEFLGEYSATERALITGTIKRNRGDYFCGFGADRTLERLLLAGT
jgi:hypothetical protein